jgi:GT2 family glycosyltransferase
MKDLIKSAAEYQANFNRRSAGFPFPKIEYVGTWENKTKGLLPKVTASMPICNQEKNIQEILHSFFTNINIETNLIIVLDSCTDGTEEKVMEFLQSERCHEKKISNVVIYRTKNDIFESSCDNFVFSITETPFFLSIQADNFLNDSTFISRGIEAMLKYPDLSGVSARGVVPFDHPRRNPHQKSWVRQTLNLPSRIFPKIFTVNFLGPFSPKLSFFGDVSKPPQSYLWFSAKAARCVFLGESIVRGPILWRSDHLALCNGFNDIAYFLGWDDYDVCYRLLKNFGLRVGYLPSTSYSLINTGTNSFPRSAETQMEYERRKSLADRNPGSISKFWDLRALNNNDSICKWEKRPF